MDIHNQQTAVLLARLFLGLVFFIQGYDKVFVVKMKNVIETFRFEFENKSLSPALYTSVAVFSSYAELIGGALLILGLFTPFALYVLGTDLLIVAIGMGLIKPVWDMDNVFSRLALMLFLLMVPSALNLFSCDYLLAYLKIYF
jgi:putative oxidoreductase